MSRCLPEQRRILHTAAAITLPPCYGHVSGGVCSTAKQTNHLNQQVINAVALAILNTVISLQNHGHVPNAGALLPSCTAESGKQATVHTLPSALLFRIVGIKPQPSAVLKYNQTGKLALPHSAEPNGATLKEKESIPSPTLSFRLTHIKQNKNKPIRLPDSPLHS